MIIYYKTRRKSIVFDIALACAILKYEPVSYFYFYRLKIYSYSVGTSQSFFSFNQTDKRRIFKNVKNSPYWHFATFAGSCLLVRGYVDLENLVDSYDFRYNLNLMFLNQLETKHTCKLLLLPENCFIP